MILPTATLKDLEQAGIVQIKGFSGIPATLEEALQAPQACQVHAMSGKVFDIVVGDRTVCLEEVTKLQELPPPF